MDPHAFAEAAKEELLRVPPRFARRVENVTLLIEEVPAAEIMKEEGFSEGEVALGLYRGTTFMLYRLPLLEEADILLRTKRAKDTEHAIRLAIRETLWRELGHHFGLMG